MDDTIAAEDPLSGEGIELSVDVGVGETIDSPATGVKLGAVSLDPVTFEEVPEFEGDWGE